jgi:putative spermidine/putrescine transport system ATP-binding protein
MAFIELHGIVKSFGKNTVVKSLSLGVEKGEFVSLLGGSGCGKTTTLRMIAGFERPDGGRVLIDGRDVDGLPPNRRNLGMVFQNYALFPNMSVRRNIAYGLTVAGMKKAEAERRVDEMLELIHMEDYGQRYPHQLSGGQQQRVALARAIARQPEALLLDEPLSALDAKIRLSLRDDIRAIQRRLNITTIYVTHDQEEALSISDRVAVMRAGLIEQIGTPFEIYNRPATPYVAAFIGTLNPLPCVVADKAAGILSVEGQRIEAPAPLAARDGERISVNLRPEAVCLSGLAGLKADLEKDAAEKGVNRLRGRLSNVKFLGSVVRFVVDVGELKILADSFNEPRLSVPAIGTEVVLRFDRESCVPVSGEAAAQAALG